MALSPINVSAWGGLNLSGDPGDVGLARAVSVQNVVTDQAGSIRARDGFDKVDGNAVTSPVWMGTISDGFVTVGATGLRAYNTSYAVTDTEVSTFATATHAVTANHELFVVDASFNFYSYDGTTIGGPISAGRSKYLAVQPVDDRIVGAGTLSGSNSARVTFSDPGATAASIAFSADNWVEIRGDVGVVRMTVGWENLLFVLFDYGFAVFYGNSTDSSGGSIFNYRMVRTGIGCSYDYAACAAQDGVYFINTDGVYRTTGGPPELVSGALQPFFDERNNGFFTPNGPLTSPRIHAGDDRLYVWQSGATGMFVMDFRTREWTYWVLATAPYALLPLSTPGEFLFANSTGQLHKFSPDYTDDDGTAIASHYQSGFQLLADGAKGRVRRFHLEGIGTVNHATAVDYGAAGTTASVAMGTSPAVAIGNDNRAAKGRGLSFKVSAASGAWQLNRWRAHAAGAAVDK